MIQVYCGDGKGKTTAAMGLALRAAGTGSAVFIVQFLKNRPTGEIVLLEKIPGVTVLRGKAGNNFTNTMTREELIQTAAISNANFIAATRWCTSIPTGMLVFDEICAALSTGVIDRPLVESFILNHPEGIELVLTGRNPPQFILDAADYITECRKIRHPFDRGVPARRGIEF